jgi:hypothetical protein
MSVRSIAHGISGVFNWLTSEPKNHWTLRELIPALTDNEVRPSPPRPINRVARVIERVATAGGLTGGIVGAASIYQMGLAAGNVGYLALLGNAVLPLLIIPAIAAGAAWVAGGVATLALNKMADMANGVERWAISREFKKEGKASWPRHQR